MNGLFDFVSLVVVEVGVSLRKLLMMSFGKQFRKKVGFQDKTKDIPR